MSHFDYSTLKFNLPFCRFLFYYWLNWWLPLLLNSTCLKPYRSMSNSTVMYRWSVYFHLWPSTSSSWPCVCSMASWPGNYQKTSMNLGTSLCQCLLPPFSGSFSFLPTLLLSELTIELFSWLHVCYLTLLSLYFVYLCLSYMLSTLWKKTSYNLLHSK